MHDADTDEKPEDDATFSIVVVPEHLRQQVLDHIGELKGDDSDVSGYMLNVGVRVGGTTLAAKSSSTNCTFWDTGLPMGGVDFKCTD